MKSSDGGGFGRVIVWRITQTCNMRCKFCSYSGDVQRLRKDADYGEVKRLSRLIGEYAGASGESVLISWMGGEPFLWEPLLPLSEYLYNRYRLGVSATTNGLLLSSPQIRASVVRNFSEIVVSLDGFEECDDGVRQCAGHFKRVSENIRKLRAERDDAGADLKIKVNTVLMRKNIGAFEKFCEYLSEIGVEECTFNQLGGFDRPEFYADNRLLPEQAEKFAADFASIRDRALECGLKVHGSAKYLNRIRLTCQDKKNPVEECYPGSWFWFINESGFISPCSYTSYEYKYDIRDIRSPDDLIKVEKAFRQWRQSARSKWCDDCFCTQVYDKFE